MHSFFFFVFSYFSQILLTVDANCIWVHPRHQEENYKYRNISVVERKKKKKKRINENWKVFLRLLMIFTVNIQNQIYLLLVFLAYICHISNLLWELGVNRPSFVQKRRKEKKNKIFPPIKICNVVKQRGRPKKKIYKYMYVRHERNYFHFELVYFFSTWCSICTVLRNSQQQWCDEVYGWTTNCVHIQQLWQRINKKNLNFVCGFKQIINMSCKCCFSFGVLCHFFATLVCVAHNSNLW